MDPKRIGIVGAGTMGSGIALAALYAGLDVALQDPYRESLEKARLYLEKFLAKKGLEERLARVSFTDSLESLASVDVVVEAALEDLALKREIFGRLDAICPKEAILATNTSTLSVTAIAASTKNPARVAGMHFFNPPAILELVEVVCGLQTGEAAVGTLVELAKTLNKTPVVTQDTPGFIVNRVARPFYGEALRLLGEQVADHIAIDQALEAGAGFRMGPFRLMDLIGIDVNATAMRSMYEQTFGEPRYRPHWIQMQMMQSGNLGRKTGRGFYDYVNPLPAPDVATGSAVGKGTGRAVVSEGSYAPGLTDLLDSAGWLTDPGEDAPQAGFLAAGRAEGLLERLPALEARLPVDAPLLVQCADLTLSEAVQHVQHPERLVGFDGLFLSAGRIATLVAAPQLRRENRRLVESIFASLGRTPLWIDDTPGLILPRLVSMLVNEAAFAVLEGVADAETIDLAMQLGVSYPLGPLEWGRSLGYLRVLSVLDNLHSEYREPRYRACVLLRRWARRGD